MANAVQECCEMIWKTEKDPDVPGWWEAGQLLLSFAQLSKANQTKVATTLTAPWYTWLEKEIKKGNPTAKAGNGIGSTIQGMDGKVWGKVVDDNDTVWKLESGRIAKKMNEGVAWQFAASKGVGATIKGIDGVVWGTVVEDQGEVWKLSDGRIAKKVTEGQKWNWDK